MLMHQSIFFVSVDVEGQDADIGRGGGLTTLYFDK